MCQSGSKSRCRQQAAHNIMPMRMSAQSPDQLPHAIPESCHVMRHAMSCARACAIACAAHSTASHTPRTCCPAAQTAPACFQPAPCPRAPACAQQPSRRQLGLMQWLQRALAVIGRHRLMAVIPIRSWLGCPCCSATAFALLGSWPVAVMTARVRVPPLADHCLRAANAPPRAFGRAMPCPSMQQPFTASQVRGLRAQPGSMMGTQGWNLNPDPPLCPCPAHPPVPGC